jgi:hypothetical protein
MESTVCRGSPSSRKEFCVLIVKAFTFSLLAVFISALFAVAAPSLARAHGGGVELNKREFAGPYEVALGVVPDPPAIGEIAMTLAVIELDTRTVVIRADVTMTARGPDSTVIGPLKVETDTVDPSFYDLRTTLDKEGVWVFTIDVDAPAGPGSADFIIEVKKTSSITGIITLLTLLAFVVILGLSVRAVIGQRGDKGKYRRVKRRQS